ncbi:unnamed protein product, partial [Brassica oleracea]
KITRTQAKEQIKQNKDILGQTSRGFELIFVIRERTKYF